MIRLNSTLTCMLAAAIALPAVAAPRRFVITQERIASAVTNSGMQVSPEQVTLLSSVVASIANPQLKVISIDRSYGTQSLARIECATRDQCLPFLVKLSAGTASTTSAASVPLSVSSNPQARPSPPLVHSGSPATLLLEGPHIHITVPVICLQNGALGQTVRASTRDRRITYTAHVVRDGVLEANL